VLIGLGGALLARNWYPDLRWTDFIARYWPYVLIFWGGLRVLEITVAKARSKSLPARGVSGGEWVLVVFLCLIGSGIHAAHGFTAGWPGAFTMGGVEVFGERFEYPVALEKAVSKMPRVVIDGLRGDVQISGSETDTVKVSGQRIVRSMNRAAADELGRESPVEITGDADQVTIHLGGEAAQTRSVSHTLEIGVPKGASVKVEGRSGDLRVTNVTGAVKISGRGSDVELSYIGGPVTVSGTYNGAVQFQRIDKPVEFNGSRTELRVERIPGELRIALGDVKATNIVGPMRLSTRSNDIRIDGFNNNMDITSERGDLDLRPGQTPLGQIQAHARSGNIRLSLPADAQFSMNARTNRGEIKNEFGGTLKKETESRRETLQGAVGSGPVIDLQTDRGDILVRKTGLAESTAAQVPAGKNGQKASEKILEKIEQ